MATERIGNHSHPRLPNRFDLVEFTRIYSDKSQRPSLKTPRFVTFLLKSPVRHELQRSDLVGYTRIKFRPEAAGLPSQNYPTGRTARAAFALSRLSRPAPDSHHRFNDVTFRQIFMSKNNLHSELRKTESVTATASSRRSMWRRRINCNRRCLLCQQIK